MIFVPMSSVPHPTLFIWPQQFMTYYVSCANTSEVQQQKVNASYVTHRGVPMGLWVYLPSLCLSKAFQLHQNYKEQKGF